MSTTNVERGLSEPEVLPAAAAPAVAPGYLVWWDRRRSFVVGLLGWLVVLTAWEVTVRLELVNTNFIASPTQIAAALVELVREGDLWHDLAVSGRELAFGLGLSIIVGVSLGLLMGWYRWLRELLDPFVNALYATPRIALIPLIILWFGIGIESKIVIVFLTSVFEVLVNTSAGVRSIDEGIIRTARSFGASSMQIFRTVALPSSVPFILTGLRLAVGRGLTGVVVGELFAAQAGIGHGLTQSAQLFRIDAMFAYLAIIAVTGIVLVSLLTKLERRFDAWRF
jgi:ABC-type nitrate/sulfonate/bicarbonate transport system permease component